MQPKIVVFFVLSVLVLSLWSQKSNSNYSMHKVVSGESLYKIGQQNKVTVDEILKLNPGVTAASLKPGMILRLPKKQVPDKPADKPKVKTSSDSKSQQTHVVQPKETLYSISKKYGVTIDELKAWNNLKDNSLKQGMVLRINAGKEKIPTTEKKPEMSLGADINDPKVKGKDEQPVDKPVKEELAADESPAENLSVSSLGKLFAAQQKSGAVQVIKGTADLMATSSGQNSTTYFAMHKTVPVGTVLKIKNLENGKFTYAKVIGKLPDLDENKHVLVRVSQGVAKLLQMGYGKAYVEMTYAQ